MNLWRLQTNTASEKHRDIAGLCLKNGIMAMGWSINETPVENHCGKLTFEEYKKLYGNKNGNEADNNKTVNSNVCHLAESIKEDDLVWMRYEGLYYLGRVKEDSKWQYVCDKEAVEYDAFNQRTDIDWNKIGDESQIIGAISTSLIRGKTLQKIHKEGACDFSKWIYNRVTNQEYYKDINYTSTIGTFFSSITPYGCEDLLCLWLYSKFGYVVIPSTCKPSTQTYECVLVDPKTGKHVYPQVKNGKQPLYAKDFAHFDGDVWLLSTKGEVFADESKNIFKADPEVLYQFACSDEAKKLLPNNISDWYQRII